MSKPGEAERGRLPPTASRAPLGSTLLGQRERWRRRTGAGAAEGAGGPVAACLKEAGVGEGGYVGCWGGPKLLRGGCRCKRVIDAKDCGLWLVLRTWVKVVMEVEHASGDIL